MGKALFDSMTKKEEDIPRMAVQVPHQIQALSPPELHIMALESENAKK